jgi:putative toxin-antitoxin system antitoxin component (TIGR02293 family)
MKANEALKAGEQLKANVAEIAQKARDLTEKVKERWDDTYHDIERSVRRAKAAAGYEVEERQEMVTAPSNQTDIVGEILGITVGSDQEIVRLVENKLPLGTLAGLMRHGISREEVYSLIIHPRTLKHRRSRRQPLSMEESERAVRVGRILATARTVLGDEGAALNWLRAPKKRFEGRSPMQMLPTEVGGRLVEEMLIQIDEGMFAS